MSLSLLSCTLTCIILTWVRWTAGFVMDSARTTCIGRTRTSHLFTSRLASSRSQSSNPDSSSCTDNHKTVTETMRREALAEMDLLVQHYSQTSSSSSLAFVPPRLLTSPEDAQSYLHKHAINAVLLDCDGVLYRGQDLTPDTQTCIRTLIHSNITLAFVTNNAGSNRRQLRDKLRSMLQCHEHDDDDMRLTDEQMVSSSYSCAQYLKERMLDAPTTTTTTLHENVSIRHKRIHVIGTEGLCDELRSTGFQVTGGAALDNANESSGMSREDLAAYDFDSLDPVDAVVVGLDTSFNYRKLCIANVLLQRNPEALFVATNEDAFDLVGADARHLPGNGALVKALEHASQRTAVNVGKPSVILADLLEQQHDLDPKRTLMVGDRLDTDIRFGVEGGMKSALVLTGCVNAKELIALGEGTKDEPLPDVVIPFLGMLA